jgi:xanthine dehydrogenase YagS FAD-binding subunit
MMKPFAWTTAGSASAAASATSTICAEAMTRVDGATDGAIVMAGGIDLLDLMKEGLLAPARLIGLRDLAELNAIDVERDGARLGAGVTLAALAADPRIRRHYPALATAAAGAASPQIRNVASLGGNLLQRPRCWYFRSQQHRCLRRGGVHCFAHDGENRYHAIFDNRRCAIVHPSTLATVLVALGADVQLSDATGGSRRLALEVFLTPPAGDLTRENVLRPKEILHAVHLPAIGEGIRMAHSKRGEKDAFDWPLAEVAVVLDLEPDGRCRDAAVILGAAAPAPRRAVAAARRLVGAMIDETSATAAAAAAIEDATPLADNGYKLPLFETLVRRTILAAAQA